MSNVTITGRQPVPSTQLSATDQETIFGDGSGPNPLRATGLSVYDATLPGFTAAVAVGMPMFVKNDGSGDVQPGRANATGTASVVGVIAKFKDDGSPVLQVGGFLDLTVAQWDARTGLGGGLTPGSAYYLSSAAAGDITATAPSAGGTFRTQVGIAFTATKMLIQIGDKVPN